MKFAHYDESTRAILGFYTPEIHKTIPEPHIEISDDQWKALLASPGQLVNATADGFDAPAPPTAEQLLERERAGMSATRYQAKAALHLAGILPQVEALMSDPETDKLKVFEWREKPVFRRNSPTITWAASQIGLTETQVDDLFRSAMSIEE